MANSVGEFFVTLGIKGADKTVGAISQTKKGMGELASTSLEAKAAILATVYGLERLMAHSAQFGTTLTNASTTLGVTIKELQQYQYAARQAGSSNEEMLGSFKSVQSAMTAIDLNKGLPEYLSIISHRLAAAGKSMQMSDIHNLPKMIQHFNDYAQLKGVSAGEKSTTLGQFFSGSIIAGMMRGKFNPAELLKAPAYSDGQAAQLDRVNIQMSNLKNKIEMAAGRFTAKHGIQIVEDIGKVTESVLALVEAFTRLADRLKAIQHLGKAFEGWALLFSSVAEGIDAVSDAQAGGEKGEKRKEQAKQLIDAAPRAIIALMKDKDVQSLVVPGLGPLIDVIARAQKPAPTVVNHHTVNQKIDHVGDHKDTHAVGNLHKMAHKAAKSAGQQEKNQAKYSSPATGQAN